MSLLRRSAGASLLAALLVTCSPAPEPETWFEECAAEAGLDFVHQSARERRWHFPELMGGGVGVLDFDGDGRMDVYCVQSGDLRDPAGAPGNRLYRNLGGLQFEDVTAEAGVRDRGYGMGCTAADYDGDGHTDLYVTNVGANVLYRNRGDGTFEDVTAASGTGDEGWGTSATWVDLDRDGDLDLFVTNYVDWSPEIERTCSGPAGSRDYCHPRSYDAPARDVLLLNQGDGSFRDATVTAGLGASSGHGLGVAAGDLTGDGWPDLYVANDGQANHLWVNQQDGTFREQAVVTGCALSATGEAEAGMGVQAVDVDQDGDLDLFLTHLRGETNTLYLNEGRWFRDATDSSGLGAASLRFTGFGVAFADFDNDQRLDAFTANGRVSLTPPFADEEDRYAERNLLFRGRASSSFHLVSDAELTRRPLISTSRGLAVADLDDDGSLDALVANRDGPLHLLRNRRGSQGNWIGFRVLEASGVDGLGSRLIVSTGGEKLHRLVQSGFSYCASNDPRVHIGLGDETEVDEVEVIWPDGNRESLGPFEANRYHVIDRHRLQASSLAVRPH